MPYSKDADVLPPSVVKLLWVRAHLDSGVGLYDARELTRFVMSGAITPDLAVLDNFVRAAIAAPHYTPVTVLGRVTGLGRQKINKAKMRVINAARAERDKKL